VPFVQQALENIRNCLCTRRFPIARQGSFGNLTLRRRGLPQVVLFDCLSGVTKRVKQFAGNRGISSGGLTQRSLNPP